MWTEVGSRGKRRSKGKRDDREGKMSQRGKDGEKLKGRRERMVGKD